MEYSNVMLCLSLFCIGVEKCYIMKEVILLLFNIFSYVYQESELNGPFAFFPT